MNTVTLDHNSSRTKRTVEQASKLSMVRGEVADELDNILTEEQNKWHP